LGIDLVIFDIAGTLIEDHDEVTDSFLGALRTNGIEVRDDEIKEWKGSSKREVIGHFVARQFGSCRIGALIEQTYSDFRFRIEKRYSDGGVIPIPGADETLRWLRDQKIKIATTTGFYRELRDTILRAAGWEHIFDANVCADDVAHGRPAPDMILKAMKQAGVSDPARLMNVGDTPLDLQAGTKARARAVVGVLTGKHPRERLEREPHTELLESVVVLPGLLTCKYLS
jgi:phosphonatase-like hydrolase